MKKTWRFHEKTCNSYLNPDAPKPFKTTQTLYIRGSKLSISFRNSYWGKNGTSSKFCSFFLSRKNKPIKSKIPNLTRKIRNMVSCPLRTRTLLNKKIHGQGTQSAQVSAQQNGLGLSLSFSLIICNKLNRYPDQIHIKHQLTLNGFQK